MKRALAERARGDSGTPSPTKKFARFGGRAAGGERSTSQSSSWEGGAHHESGGGGVINEQRRHAPPPQDRSRATAPAQHHDYNAVQQQQAAMGSIPVDHDVTAATVGVQGSTGSGLVKMTNHHHQHYAMGHDQGATTATNTVDSSVPFGDIAPPLSSPPAAAEVPSGSIPISMQQVQQVQQQPSATTPSVVSNASSAVPPPPQSQSQAQAQTPPIRSPQPPPSYSSAVAAAAMTGFGLRRTSSKPSVIHSTPLSSSGNNDRADASAAADDDDEDDEEDGTSPTRRYYLQFQNRALVTELHRLKHELSVLSDERTVRRAECTKARTAVEELHECWRGLEVELARAVGDSSASEAATTRHSPAPPQSRPPGEEDEDGVDGGDEDGRTRRRRQQHQITVPSSGEGTDVESSGMLLASLGRLAVANSSSLPPPAPPSASPPLFKEGEDPVAAAEAAAALDYAHLTTSLLDPLKARVEAIASLLLRLVREYHRIATDGGGVGRGVGKPGSPERIEAEAERTRASMQSRIDAQTVHIAELAAGRDAATKAERRLRRYLNRIAAGQSPEEVLRDVEGLHHHNALDEDEYSAASSAPLSHLTPLGKRSRRTITSVGSTSSTTAATPDGRRRRGSGGGGGGDTGTPGADGEGSDEGDRANDELARRYRAEVVELEGVAGARQDRIEELMKEREGLQRRVNKLLLPSSSSSEADGRGEGAGGGGDDPGGGESREAVSRHPLYQDLAAKLDLMSQQNELLKQDAEEWKAKLASKAGEIDALKKGMDDQRSKFEKRWKECVSEAKSVTGAADKEDNGNRNEGAVPDVPSSSGATSSGTSQEDSASKILILEHKLEHALESARRIEVYRSALSEACAMVESLQRQGTDLREKYHNALSANRQSSSSSSSSHRSKEASDRRGSDSGPSSSSLSSEKLQRENKKFRKEILALQLSRDANKSKLERLQNDKDNLVKTNSRLVQQSSEKEEINAEALSTILHLKQQLELHSQEKDALEKKKKSVEQLALASRLAANAKERVSEEENVVISEMEKGLDDAKRERAALLETIREKDSRVEQTKHQMVSLVRDLQITKARCDELASESNKVLDDKARVVEDLHVARKQVVELKKTAAAAAASSASAISSAGGGGVGGGGRSQFTAEQLSTQLSVLKGRLACPVCNFRDKNCILTRCRHMFCRQCVDNNIKNRSRKCPACGIRFDTKDVGEIWL